MQIPSSLWLVVLLTVLLHYDSVLSALMPARTPPVVLGQSSILPFLRQKRSEAPDGSVINVAISDDDDDGFDIVTPAPPLIRRRIIHDDDDDVHSPSAAPSSALHMSVSSNVAIPNPDGQQPDSRTLNIPVTSRPTLHSLSAPVTPRPVVIASPAVELRDDSDRDVGHQFEDEVFGRR